MMAISAVANRAFLLLPCRAFDSAESRVQEFDQKRLFGVERVPKNFSLNFPKRQGKRRAALPCRLSLLRRHGCHRLGRFGFLLPQPPTGSTAPLGRSYRRAGVGEFAADPCGPAAMSASKQGKCDRVRSWPDPPRIVCDIALPLRSGAEFGRPDFKVRRRPPRPILTPVVAGL